MKTDNILYWVIYFVISIIIAWIVLSLILLWFRPAFYNANGSVNWWVTLWVAALIVLFSWLAMVILTFIIGLFQHCAPACGHGPECRKVECRKECDPCAVGHNKAFEPRMWM